MAAGFLIIITILFLIIIVITMQFYCNLVLSNIVINRCFTMRLLKLLCTAYSKKE